MIRTVRLREEADQDLAAAASWYERQRPGLGHEFLAEALAAFQTQDVTCGATKLAPKANASSLYVRRGGKWLGVHYQETALK